MTSYIFCVTPLLTLLHLSSCRREHLHLPLRLQRRRQQQRGRQALLGRGSHRLEVRRHHHLQRRFFLLQAASHLPQHLLQPHLLAQPQQRLQQVHANKVWQKGYRVVLTGKCTII